MSKAYQRMSSAVLALVPLAGTLQKLVCIALMAVSVRAFGWDDGVTSLVWETSAEVRSSPAIAADGSIIVGNDNGELLSLNLDGTTNTVWNAGGLIYSSPAIGRDGTIYVGSSDNQLYAFNPDGSTGHVWTAEDRIFMSSPAVEGSAGRIYVGSEDRKLYCFNPDGTTARVWSTFGEIQSSPALSPDGTIYVGSGDGKFYAFNQNGATSRVWTTGGAIRSSPAIGTNGLIFIGSSDGNLYAFDPNGSTSRVWTTAGAIHSSPVISTNGSIYVGSFDNKLYEFSADSTNSRFWSTTGPVESAPVLGADGTIYAGTREGYFFAFNPDGTTDLVWHTEGLILSSPAISSNGAIYVGSSDGNVYAFDGTGGKLAESPWPKFRQNIENTGFMFSGPTNTACSEGTHTDKVLITWNAPIDLGGTTGYEVWRNLSNDTSSAENIDDTADTSFEDATAEAGTTYYYWIRGTNEAWKSRFGAPDYGYKAVIAAPLAPANAVASDGDYFNRILVSWSESTNASGYNVWRNTIDDFSGSEKINMELVATNMYSDTDPGLGETCYYWISATNASGSSGFSKPSASGYRDLAPPSGMNASWGDYADKVRITWLKVTDAGAYAVFRSTVSNSAGSAQIGYTSSLILDDLSGESGNIYYYWVKSVLGTYTGMLFSACSAGSFGGTTSHVWKVVYGVGAPAIGTNGVLYMGAGESGSSFYEFDPGGTTNRAWSMGGAVGSAAAVGSNGTIYVPGAWSNRLFALNPNGTTSKVWSATGAIFAPPAIGSNGVLYAGSYDGKLYAFNPNGQTNIIFSNGGSERSPTIGADGTIYSARGSTLYAFTPSGATSHVWTIADGAFSASAAINANGTILIPSQAGSLYAFNPDGTTSRVWTVPSGYSLASSPVVGIDGIIYVGCENSCLYAFNQSGTTSRVWALDGPVRASPAIGSDGTIYAGAEGGKFYALNANGTTNRLWSAPGAIYSSPAIGTNGIVYVSISSGAEGMLCAYYGTGGTLANTPWPKARNNNENSSRDPSLPAVPAAPTEVSADKGISTNIVGITWSSAHRATGYEVHRSTSNDTSTAALLGSVSSGTSYSDTTAEREPLYYYWIRAKNADGTGDFSASTIGCLAVPPPSGVSATDGLYINNVQVEWQSVNPHSGSTSYEVWRGTTTNAALAGKINTVITTNHGDSSVSAGLKYYYWIKAKDSYGSSEVSAAASGYRALSPPSGLSATEGIYRDKVQVRWNSSPGAEGYGLWRSTNDESSAASRITRTTETYYDDSSVTSRVVYFYWVKSTNSLNTSDFSASVFGYSVADTIPDPPSYVSASKGTFTSKVVLAWGSVSNAHGYQVWRHTNETVASAKQLAFASGTSYDDTTTERDMVYYYWVKATNSAGASSFGLYDIGFSSSPADPPSWVSATDGEYTNKVEITWASVPDIIGYQVWRNTTNSSAAADSIGETGTTSFTDTNAVRGLLYYYWIRSTNQVGPGAFSVPDTGYSRAPYVINDYDGDGKSDLAVFDGSSGYWFVSNLDEEILQLQWGWSSAIPVPGDYLGDGKSDLAMFDGSNGYWYICSAEGALIAWQYPWGWPGAEPVPGDYDGDGRADLAVFDSGSGYWYISSLSGSFIVGPVAWGWPGAEPVPGDFDGDGMSDLAVFDSNTGYWYIMSLDGRLLAWEFPWGWPGAAPVSGDFNGDGKTDITVFDENTSSWYIISLDGTLITWALAWGVKDAVPVAGDYTGNGISDISVFDIYTGNWYIISLDGELALMKSWGWSGVLPIGLGTWHRCKPDPDDPSTHAAVGSWKTSADEIFNINADGTVSGTDSSSRSFTGNWTSSSDTTVTFSIYREGGSYKNPFTIEAFTDTTGTVSNSSGISASITRI